nr:restriction endonuclease subunit S [Desulforhopalus vacuolatus]
MVKLSEVAPAKPLKTDKYSGEDHILHITLDNIESETGSLLKRNYAPVNEAGNSTHWFNSSHVLYSKLRPYLNKVYLPDETGIGTTELVPMLPNEKVLDRRYLAYFLRSKNFVDWVTLQTAGAKMPRVSMKVFWDHEIPLPPLTEQKRIAAILDKADTIRRKRQQGIQLADDFLRAVFLDMFGDPVTNPKGWERLPLKKILDRIDSGWSPKCYNREPAKNEWGVLKLGAVTTCNFIEGESKALPSDLVPRPQLEVKKGDLLFSRKNTYNLVAACALVNSTRPKLMLSDLIFRLRINEKAKVVPAYLWALLTHSGKRKKIQGIAGGAAGSMPNISKKRLLEQLIEIPNYKLQQEFSLILAKTIVLKYNFYLGVEENEYFFNSLTQRAFRGEL